VETATTLHFRWTALAHGRLMHVLSFKARFEHKLSSYLLPLTIYTLIANMFDVGGLLGCEIDLCRALQTEQVAYVYIVQRTAYHMSV
jgi:hypothetical protein